MSVITGWTLQLGGPRIFCDQGLANDREWFAPHHGRSHRIRPPIGGEVEAIAADRAALGVNPRWKP